MKISTKGRYALRMLVDLSEHEGQGFISLKDIAARQEISKKYLEQIVPALNQAGILETNRGFQGGYRLKKKPDACTVGEVLRLTEGGLSPVACIENGKCGCNKSADCPTLPVWLGLEKVMGEYLDGITIADLLFGARSKEDEK